MHRRTFLKSLSLSALVPNSAWSGIVETGLSPQYLSAASDHHDRHYIVATSADGDLVYKLPILQRAHAIAKHPRRPEAVAIARRPGTTLTRFDTREGRQLEVMRSPIGQHWYGHAVFSRSGDQLFITENDYRSGRGLIAVLDTTDGFRRMAEWESGGIGPHELLRLDNGDLFICNGGILTHPETGREALNLDEMQPNITLIDGQTGRIRERQLLDERYRLASIRHCARLKDNAVAVVMQNQVDSRGKAPLVALYKPGIGLQALWAPRRVQIGLKDYCGSVRADRGGEHFLVSSPRGNRLMAWSSHGHFLGEVRISDVCGLAATDVPRSWLVTNGNGEIYLAFLADGLLRIKTFTALPELRFDNHLTSLADS